MNLNTLSKTKLNKIPKAQRVIFLRVNPELHAALKAKAKNEGATINKFLTAHIEQLNATATPARK